MIEIDIITGKNQEKLTKELEGVYNETRPGYYVGGTLCLDMNVAGEKEVVMIELNETVHCFSNDQKRTLNTTNTILAFEIYAKNKGTNSYFKENLAKSHVRHLKEFTNRRYKLAK